MFKFYLEKLSLLAKTVTYESFVAIQKLQADIQNSYTKKELSQIEKRALYATSNILLDSMRHELGSNGDNRLYYRDFQAGYKWSDKDGRFVGSVIPPKDILKFDGESLNELIENFHSLVDDYLAMREEMWKKGATYGA